MAHPTGSRRSTIIIAWFNVIVGWHDLQFGTGGLEMAFRNQELPALARPFDSLGRANRKATSTRENLNHTNSLERFENLCDLIQTYVRLSRLGHHSSVFLTLVNSGTAPLDLSKQAH